MVTGDERTASGVADMTEIWDEPDLDLAAIARTLLRSRDNDFRQPGEVHQGLAAAVATRANEVADRVAPELTAMRAARGRLGLRALLRYRASVVLTLGLMVGAFWSFAAWADGGRGWQGWLALVLFLGGAGCGSAAISGHVQSRRYRFQAMEAAQDLAEATEV